jgi:hypothetical protein
VRRVCSLSWPTQSVEQNRVSNGARREGYVVFAKHSLVQNTTSLQGTILHVTKFIPVKLVAFPEPSSTKLTNDRQNYDQISFAEFQTNLRVSVVKVRINTDLVP